MSNTFEPLNIHYPEYQIDGSGEFFQLLAESALAVNKGSSHAQILRYMLSCNIIQYQCQSQHPVVWDFGCGAATFKSFWDANYQVSDKKSIQYLGFEINPEYLRDGKALNHTLHEYDANNQDIRHLALELKPDVILMQQFIEHIDRKAFVYLLNYVHEILGDQGSLVISAPNPRGGNKIVENHHDYEYPFPELKILLGEHGFEIDQHFGWLGLGTPDSNALSEIEKNIFKKLQFVSTGYANAVMSYLNPQFAPYYYLKVRKK